MKQTIGIIGMGVSGLAVLLALSHQKKDDLANMEIFVSMTLSTSAEASLFKKMWRQL
ncbi:Uncharacterised protein [Streptococcus pseudoporcinus]|uniref:Uncharacterized protein n=1 Tax=Streptococcus pseudoporcinus TaxID=361101 RepID=A0A4U9YD30_9STRE|nr:hypothetical protein [Streptococcus pseudoporcinus]VTS24473.1 Uncharacterised protein [Streptococcus pseudoporcinus]